MINIGVIGAGTMGRGIATVFAMNEEFNVILSSRNIDSAQKGKEKVIQYLTQRVEKGKLTEENKNRVISRIEVKELQDFNRCNLVIEAIVEDLEIKREVFKYLDKVCNKETLFASNTSSLSIKDLSAGLSRHILGMHFFNPAIIMQLVEVVQYDDRQKEDIDKIVGIVKKIGKEPVIVSNSYGFIVNRLLIPYINDAINVLSENIATKADIDKAMKLGANHPIGPLALADMIGLDVVLAIMRTFEKEYKEDRYIPSKLLVSMVQDGKIGKKVGEGFYKY